MKYKIGEPITIKPGDIEPYDTFHATRELMERIIEAENLAIKNEIEANAVVINGRKYGMIKDHPGLRPTIFGMRASTRIDMPDDWDFFIQQTPPMILTNADRIRAMTDEELATEMYKGCGERNWSVCRIPKVCEERDVLSISEEEEDEICVQCWIDWLKSPVEVDG